MDLDELVVGAGHARPCEEGRTRNMERGTRNMERGTTPNRIDSLDLARGLVMVVMAIDHVRCYAGVPAGGPDPAIFFTRWVTNFCAPAFAFFAGTGAFLYGQRVHDRAKL